MFTNDVQRLSPSITCKPDPTRPYKYLRSKFVTISDIKYLSSSSPYLSKGFSRDEMTLLHRLRTHSARTRACLYKIKSARHHCAHA